MINFFFPLSVISAGSVVLRFVTTEPTEITEKDLMLTIVMLCYVFAELRLGAALFVAHGVVPPGTNRGS